jgi:hypothetical protein
MIGMLRLFEKEVFDKTCNRENPEPWGDRLSHCLDLWHFTCLLNTGKGSLILP